jgi:hypothetical protein
MQANNVDAQNQAVVYSNFAVTGTAQPFSDNFLADSVLDTTNTWDTSPSPGSAGIFIAPAGSAFWLSWTLPDSGFSLETAPTLTNLLAWTSPSTGPIIAMNSIRSQLVASNEVPSGSTAFFRLVKRVATQLQVLLPGETNAPNTTTGKTGTPTPLSFSASGGLVNVTINSVDSTWHLVNTTDVVHLTDTDTSGNGATPSDTALQGGTLTEQVAFGATGAYTVTPGGRRPLGIQRLYSVSGGHSTFRKSCQARYEKKLPESLEEHHPPRIHIDRVAGGNSHHRHPGGHAVARLEQGQGPGTKHLVHE